MTTSLNHVAFHGRFEYFYVASGDLCRAPKSNPIGPDGHRMGARFEATPVAAAALLKAYGIVSHEG